MSSVTGIQGVWLVILNAGYYFWLTFCKQCFCLNILTTINKQPKKKATTIMMISITIAFIIPSNLQIGLRYWKLFQVSQQTALLEVLAIFVTKHKLLV
jgi:hypothetical protein